MLAWRVRVWRFASKSVIGRSSPINVLDAQPIGIWILSANDVEDILEAGGSVKIAALAPEILIRLAEVAHDSGVRLEIDAHGMSAQSMTKIAKAGRGHVLFDLTAWKD